MGLILESTIAETFIFCLTALVVAIVGYFQNVYQYWAKLGVPTLPPTFPLGNSNILLPKGFSLGVHSKTYYDYFKTRGLKFGGIYLMTEPNLVVNDPDLIKDILSKDFQYFVDRGFYFNGRDDPVSANLFAVDGDQWKEQRVKLTPTFTSSKMKMMFQIVVKCAEHMLEALGQREDLDVDIKEVMGRFTTDIIGSCAFGIDCNSFKHPDAEFRKMGKKIFHFGFWRSVRAFFIINLPKLAHLLRLTNNDQDVGDFFIKLVGDTIRFRKATQTERPDFLQILMDLGESACFSLQEMAAQAFLFFSAGFESSSIVMTFTLYELAKNPDCQKKLRKEIGEVLAKHGDQITYESLSEMKYLSQVFDEVLRIYPPGATLNRRCVKNYKLRGTDMVIEKGTQILISAFGLHRDPEYYPEPEKFDPERFTEELKKERHPYVFLPFGDGPRNCIGLRFGTMQVKIGIVSVIRNFEVFVSPNMRPLRFDSTSFTLRTLDEVLLNCRRVQKV